MAEDPCIVAIDVVLEPSAVVGIASVGVQGPPGTPGAPGPAGPAGPQGEPGPAAEVSGDIAVDSVSVGTNPAQSGALRLANNQAIVARNAANTADLPLLQTDGANNVFVGSLTSGSTTYIRSSGGGLRLQPTNADYNVDENGIYPGANNTRVLGHASVRFATLNLGTAINLKEATAPAAPAADCANLWLEDNGAGKSRLMIQFATGAAIAIATQV